MPLWPCLANLRARAEQPGIRLDELVLRLAELRRPRLAVQPVEQRLGIEGFQMARAAGHEQEDDRLRLGLGPMRAFRGQRVGAAASSCSSDARARPPKPQKASRRKERRITGGVARNSSRPTPVALNSRTESALRLNIARANSFSGCFSRKARASSFSFAVGVAPAASTKARSTCRAVVRAALADQALGEGLGQAVGELAVEQFQRLQGVGARLPAGTAGLGVGLVEDLANGSGRLRLASRYTERRSCSSLFGVTVHCEGS